MASRHAHYLVQHVNGELLEGEILFKLKRNQHHQPGLPPGGRNSAEVAWLIALKLLIF
jgi:hypothetical protein